MSGTTYQLFIAILCDADAHATAPHDIRSAWVVGPDGKVVPAPHRTDPWSQAARRNADGLLLGETS